MRWSARRRAPNFPRPSSRPQSKLSFSYFLRVASGSAPIPRGTTPAWHQAHPRSPARDAADEGVAGPRPAAPAVGVPLPTGVAAPDAGVRTAGDPTARAIAGGGTAGVGAVGVPAPAAAATADCGARGGRAPVQGRFALGVAVAPAAGAGVLRMVRDTEPGAAAASAAAGHAFSLADSDITELQTFSKRQRPLLFVLRRSRDRSSFENAFSVATVTGHAPPAFACAPSLREWCCGIGGQCGL